MQINGSGPRSGTEVVAIGGTEYSMFYVEVNTTVREGGISSVKQHVTIPLGYSWTRLLSKSTESVYDRTFGRTLW